jgi:hypothetical protein
MVNKFHYSAWKVCVFSGHQYISVPVVGNDDFGAAKLREFSLRRDMINTRYLKQQNHR